VPPGPFVFANVAADAISKDVVEQLFFIQRLGGLRFLPTRWILQQVRHAARAYIAKEETARWYSIGTLSTKPVRPQGWHRRLGWMVLPDKTILRGKGSNSTLEATTTIIGKLAAVHSITRRHIATCSTPVLGVPPNAAPEAILILRLPQHATP
jgi:hypothetical protein